MNVILASGQIKVRFDPLTTAAITLHKVPLKVVEDELQLVVPFTIPEVVLQEALFTW